MRTPHAGACLPVAALAVVLVGCGNAAALPADGTPRAVGDLVRLFNWENYIDPEVVAAFEAEHGIRVTIDTFDDENEMLSVVVGDTSRYDVISASDYTVAEMAAQRLLAELDLRTIPNLKNIDPRYLDLPTDPGNRYSTPYDWGTTGIAYDHTCFEPERESWDVLFDPRIAGRVSMDSDHRIVIGAMLKFLGYSNSTGDRGALGEVVDLLVQKQAQQGLRFLEWSDAFEALGAGDLCAAQVFNGDAAYHMAENEDLRFFVPAEGSDYYLDSFAIPRDAPNKAGAELFLDFLLRPDMHAANTAFTGYANPNRAALEAGLIEPKALEDPVCYPDTDGLEAWQPFDSDRRALWNEAWADIQRSGADQAAPS